MEPQVRDQLVGPNGTVFCDWIFELDENCVERDEYRKILISGLFFQALAFIMVASLEVYRLGFLKIKLFRAGGPPSALDLFFIGSSLHFLFYGIANILLLTDTTQYHSVMGFFCSVHWTPIVWGGNYFFVTILGGARNIFVSKVGRQMEYCFPKKAVLNVLTGLLSVLSTIPFLVFEVLAGHYHDQGDFDKEQFFFRLGYMWIGVGAFIQICFFIFIGGVAFKVFQEVTISHNLQTEFIKIKSTMIVVLGSWPGGSGMSMIIGFAVRMFAIPVFSKILCFVSYNLSAIAGVMLITYLLIRNPKLVIMHRSSIGMSNVKSGSTGNKASQQGSSQAPPNNHTASVTDTQEDSVQSQQS